MAERLTLDTGVLISAERGRLDLAAAAGDDADATVSAVVVAEFLTGVHLATTAAQRTARRDFLDRALRTLPIDSYTQRVAERHSELLAHVRRSGTARGAHDLIIAATALATDRIVLTTDVHAHFDDLPGVRSRVVSPGR